MIVEFIGSTGAGKTSLISEVRHKLAQSMPVTTSFDLIAEPLGLSGVTHPTAQNLIQELVAFPFFIYTLNRHWNFLVHTIKKFSRNPRFSVHTINNVRSLERKLGMYELTKRYQRDRIVLVDEGPLLAAHMFVFAGAVLSSSEIEDFAASLPLPDLVVYVQAPTDVLIRRTLQRPDPPREMDTKNTAVTEKYVREATAIFDQLVETDAIKGRSLIVENSDATEEEHARLVDQLACSIINRGHPIAATHKI